MLQARLNGPLTPRWRLASSPSMSSPRTRTTRQSPRPPSDARTSRAALREFLDQPGVGSEFGQSMQAIRAICHCLGNQSDLNPAVIGALELINDAAHVSQVMAVVGRAGGSLGQATRVGTANRQSDVWRAVGAARIVLMGFVTFRDRKLTLDEGTLRAAVIHSVEHMANGFEQATPEAQARAVEGTRNIIFGLVGQRPSIATTRAALLVGTRGWDYANPAPSRSAARVAARARRGPTRASTTMTMLRELGIAPNSEQTLKKTVERQRWGFAATGVPGHQ